jgi:hypothetical protein
VISLTEELENEGFRGEIRTTDHTNSPATLTNGSVTETPVVDPLYIVIPQPAQLFVRTLLVSSRFLPCVHHGKEEAITVSSANSKVSNQSNGS